MRPDLALEEESQVEGVEQRRGAKELGVKHGNDVGNDPLGLVDTGDSPAEKRALVAEKGSQGLE